MQDIAERLTRIETMLEGLVRTLEGNGQPGRCKLQGDRLDKLEQWRSMLVGAWLLVTMAFGAWAALK